MREEIKLGIILLIAFGLLGYCSGEHYQPLPKIDKRWVWQNMGGLR